MEDRTKLFRPGGAPREPSPRTEQPSPAGPTRRFEPSPAAPRPPPVTPSAVPRPRTALAPQPAPPHAPPVVTGSLPLESVRDFALVRVLGAGGMAKVYLGRHARTQALAAVKMLHGQLATDQEFVQRFLHEVKATASLRHENVVEILDCGEDRGLYFLATEYMDKGSVKDLLARVHRIPPPVATAIFAQVLNGLSYAHQMGVVHRDVKPANLMVNSTGQVKVCDFGIARTEGTVGLTQTGQLIGTPAYMSPEQAQGRAATPKSDLFSAGIVLYEMLTGFNPYAGENETATLLNLMQAEPRILFEVDPTVPPALEHLLGRLLDRDPEARYASATEVLEDMRRFFRAQVESARETVAEFVADPEGVAARLHQRSAREWYDTAMRLVSAGPSRRNQAVVALQRALLLEPSNTRVQEELRKLFGGKLPGAAESQNPKIVELEAQVAKDPHAHGALMHLASLYRLEGNLIKAIGCYKRVLRLRPGDSYTQSQLAVLLGEEEALTGMQALAQTPGFRTRSAMRPAQPTAPDAIPAAPPAPTRSALSQLLSGRAARLGLVAAVLALLVLSVRSIGSFISSATTGVDESTTSLQKELEQARRAKETGELKRELDRASDQAARAARTLLDKGVAEIRGARYEEGVATLMRLREEHPKRPEAVEARYHLGTAYLAQEKPDDAALELAAFVDEAPSSPRVPEARMRRAEALTRGGRTDEAMAEYRGVIADHSGSPLVTRAMYELARLHEEAGEVEEARPWYEQVTSRTGPSDELHRAARAALERIQGKP